MKFLGRFLIGLLLLGNLLFLAALSLHVVRSPGKFTVLPKSQLTLIDVFVDTTNWTADQLNEHPAVVARLMQAGKGQMLSHVTGVSVSAVRPTQKTTASEGPRSKSVFDVPGQN
jgi:hypothetical protein